MRYIIVVFSIRSDTLTFYNTLKTKVGFCSIVNTPHALSRSCGISVKIPASAIELARQIASRINSFKGIYEVNAQLGHTQPIRIY